MRALFEVVLYAFIIMSVVYFNLWSHDQDIVSNCLEYKTMRLFNGAAIKCEVVVEAKP